MDADEILKHHETARLAAMCTAAAADLVLGSLYPTDEGPISLDTMADRIANVAVDMAVRLDGQVRARLAEQHVNDPPPSGKAILHGGKLGRTKGEHDDK